MQVEAKVVYQRRAPDGDPRRSQAAKRLWAVYEYGTHVFKEFFSGGGSRRKQTTVDAYAVMDGYKTGMDERRAESKTVLVVDQLEMEQQPLRDSNGNEMYGAAIDRLAAMKQRVRAFLTGKE